MIVMMINQFILESIVITFHRSIIIRISSLTNALRFLVIENN